MDWVLLVLDGRFGEWVRNDSLVFGVIDRGRDGLFGIWFRVEAVRN